MRTIDQQSIRIERCPYLGLHDDPSTALAYPSHWNYCYHAEPPASILVPQQVNVCLTAKYVDCTIMVSNKWGHLPSDLRSKTNKRVWKRGSSGRLLWFILFVLVILILILVLFPGQNPLF